MSQLSHKNTILSTAPLTFDILMQEIRYGDVDHFRSVLNREGLPQDSNWFDYELLMNAIKLDRKSIVHLLLDKDCRLLKRLGRHTPLHLAVVKSDWIDVIERLLEKGSGVHFKTNFGNTPLHLAFVKNAPHEIIDLLLTNYFQKNVVDISNNHGLSFLHIACTRPYVEIVEKILEFSIISINQQVYETMYTPLHFAVKYGQYEIIKVLLEYGADINKQDSDSLTPLHMALWLREVPMIDLLLAYDKNKQNIVNTYGVSHFMIACAGSDEEVVKNYFGVLLCQSEIYPRQLIATKTQNFGMYQGYTPLHFAVSLGCIGTVELLLNCGADCCATANNDVTSHTIARKRGDVDICQILQDHCDIMRMCRETRAQSPDFGNWDDNYENSVLIERSRTLKYLQKTLDFMKNMNSSMKDVIHSNNDV